ncbi:hypothetical protein QBC47DRAFT_438461 [Echria macrotheca]|uniref:Uncharacterized protein n=1 Tax=Echria macrotheca TaxID=438768 RepID=A0AAJ0B512_9PEZI|nr:hypothetical protein QBC47DRAFT_438461 [Echria macrotheca]
MNTCPWPEPRVFPLPRGQPQDIQTKKRSSDGPESLLKRKLLFKTWKPVAAHGAEPTSNSSSIDKSLSTDRRDSSGLKIEPQGVQTRLSRNPARRRDYAQAIRDAASSALFDSDWRESSSEQPGDAKSYDELTDKSTDEFDTDVEDHHGAGGDSAVNGVATEDTIVPITQCGDRLYSEWAGVVGGGPIKIRGVGALFPEGYSPRFDQSYPWICPIRDCQTVFLHAWGLGGHFSAGHRGCLLNDNRDGTMSIVGSRKETADDKKRIPAIVVSRNMAEQASLPPKASPRRPDRPVDPDTPSRSKQKPLSDANNGISKQRSSEGQDRQSSSVWNYLLVYMPYNTPKPSNLLIQELLSMTQLRNLPYRWRVQLAGGYPSLKTIFVLLVFLTGKKAEEPCQLCNGTNKTKDFPECIIPTSMASAGLKKAFGVNRCCNAVYSAPREVEGLPSETRNVPLFSRLGRDTSPTPTPSLSSDDEMTDGAAILPITPQSGRPSRRFLSAKKSLARNASNRDTPTDTDIPIDPVRSKPIARTPLRTSRNGRTIKSKAAKAKPTSPATPASSSPDDHAPPMEKWEMAPGKLTLGDDSSFSSQRSQAFSAPYLKSKTRLTPIPLSPSTTFQLLHILPGTTHHLVPTHSGSDNNCNPSSYDGEEHHTLRICSVAKGRLSITLYDKSPSSKSPDERRRGRDTTTTQEGDEFRIGTNGMWTVPGSRDCVLRNPFGTEAVVHVCAVVGWSTDG